MLLSVTDHLDRRAGRDFISNAKVVAAAIAATPSNGRRLLVAEVEATLSGEANIRATVENGWFVTLFDIWAVCRRCPRDCRVLV